MSRQFTTDCEGPTSKNDNAQELTSTFVPEGSALFARVRQVLEPAGGSLFSYFEPFGLSPAVFSHYRKEAAR